MGTIITLAFHHLKLLFKSKSLLIILFLIPILVSGGITFALQKAYTPAVKYLAKPKNEKDLIDFSAKKINAAATDFSLTSDLYPLIEKEMIMDNKLPVVAENATTHFLKILLPVYYPKFAKLIDHSMSNLNIILIIISSIALLPAIFGVFLMNIDRKDQTLSPLIAQGVSSIEYFLSKFFAGFLIALFLTAGSIGGYLLGAYATSISNSETFSLNVNAFNTIGIIGIVSAFCAVSISILISLIFSDNKTQIIISGIFTPLLVIAIYLFAMFQPTINGGIKDIKEQLAVVKIERVPVDKKEVPFLAERQIYDRSQMVAVKLGSEILPDMIKTIPSNTENISTDSVKNTTQFLLGATIISIVLSMFLAMFRFRN